MEYKTPENDREWQSLLHDFEGAREALEQAAAELDSLAGEGGWHQIETPVVEELVRRSPLELAFAILKCIKAARESPSSRSPVAQKAVSAITTNLDRFVELGARFEKLWDAVQAGQAFLDPRGELVNQLLEQKGIERPGPDLRESLFEVTGKNIPRDIHEAWLDPNMDAPDPLWERIRPELLREVKKLTAKYGTDDQLGAYDRELNPSTKRAASRLKKNGNWDAEACERLDKERPFDSPALQGLVTECVERDSDEQNRGLELIAEFLQVEATAEERDLIEALGESDRPADALRSVGDEGNWSRFQSLQKKICRRRLAQE